MSSNVIDEYLLKLGAVVDQGGLQNFRQAMREASQVADANATSIVGSMLKAQTEIMAGFAAIGGATLGMVDKVAMADQSYRLLGLHMMLSKDNARGLKIAMDALGEPLENLTWDKELNARTHQLLEDQRHMAPNGDFDAQLRKVRDIRFEFTRMEVEGQYLAMHVVQDFLKALGYGPDELLNKLRGFNKWVIDSIPQIAQTLTDDFMPVWHDMERIASQLGHGVYEATGAFQNLVGVLSGDESIQTSTVTLDSFAKALEHVADTMASVTSAALELESILPALVKILPDFLVSQSNELMEMVYRREAVQAYKVGDKVTGDERTARANAAHLQFEKSGTKAVDSFYDWYNDHGAAVADKMGYSQWIGASNHDVHSLIDRYAVGLIDPRVAHALAMAESGEQQFDAAGNVLKNPKSSALGVMQLTRDTARTQKVNPYDTEDNIRGGMKLLQDALKAHHGDVPLAIAAYGAGEEGLNKILAGKATLGSDARRDIVQVERALGHTGDVHVGSIVVHIDHPQPSNDHVGSVVAAHIKALQGPRTQRNIAEIQDLSPGY